MEPRSVLRRVLSLYRRRVVWTVAAVVALGSVGSAYGALFGQYSLTYGSCCGGATLNGTRAYIDVSSISPDSTHCIAFSSAVVDGGLSQQLQATLVRCGSNANVDGTCSTSNNFVKAVEIIPSGVCYQHGSASTGGSYLVTVDEPYNDGTWYTFIAGTGYETQSGYDNNVAIPEFGEYTGSSCSGWSASASFDTWQRYYYAGNTWTNVSTANPNNGGCWTLGTLSSSNFTVSH